jgi:uncharacterized membrane protein YkvA (DUF1232 family)
MEDLEQKSRPKHIFELIKSKARSLKREIKVLYLAYKSPGTPWYAKLLCAVVVGYALSPIDLIPDFIPILGYLDDLLLIPLGVWLVIKLVPEDVLNECRAQAEDVFKDGKPKNWAAAIVIVLIWIIVIGLIIYKFIYS